MTKKLRDNSNHRQPLFNDPIYGFISFRFDIIYELIEHPWFQRLRRIAQLGLTQLIYEGAKHTRFQHAIGATHLMAQAIKELKNKGIPITDEEEEAACIAILLHDIGHGPYSHTLEHSIVEHVSHETISVLFMRSLNEQFNGRLTRAIEIFEGRYKKAFLHQLVSSQLDVDRLDYLRRDSFFSGVSEGVIGSERIIKLLTVRDDSLAIDYKGIYSIEKFLVARRLMYWQVYLHKTAVAADYHLLMVLKRARHLAEKGIELFCTPPLRIFLYGRHTTQDFLNKKELLPVFAQLDDYDVFTSIKVWCGHQDKTLAILCKMLIERRLPKIELQSKSFPKKRLAELKKQTAQYLEIPIREAQYFVYSDKLVNNAYNSRKDRINVVMRDGRVKDVAKAADLLNISVLSKPVTKHFLCYPKYLTKG